jgi:hypothetical protein
MNHLSQTVISMRQSGNRDITQMTPFQNREFSYVISIKYIIFSN